MNRSRWLVILVGVSALAVGFGLGAAVGQQTPPKDNKGVEAKVESTVDLGPDIPGYQLRLRTITVEPGGVVGLHSHRERPAFAYILQGTFTELRPGGSYTKSLSQGGIITESRDVEHWGENKGSSKVVIIGVDVVKPQ
jgi:quercetin dioxygenase-like cupin family protein